MAKYPNFGYRGMPDMGCLATIVIFVLGALCPPLALIGFIVYGIYKDHFER